MPPTLVRLPGDLQQPQHQSHTAHQTLSTRARLAGHQARENGLAFNIHVRRDVPQRFVGDPQRLGQVLLNLASNAVKFTTHGKIEITVSVTQRANGRICLSCAVSDTGIGLSDAQSRTIFEAFTQADSSTTRRYGGTGLGLSISGHLVKKMDGELDVKSQLGKGSTFSFTAWMEMPNEGRRQPEHVISLDGIRLLLAGPQFAGLIVLSEMLERGGASVITIDDAGRALGSGPCPFDIIVLDIRGGNDDAWYQLQPLLPSDAKVMLLADSGNEKAEHYGVNCLQGPVTPLSLSRNVARTLGYAVSDSREEKQTRNQKALEGRRVLLVEDNAINQQVGRGLLEERGIAVTVVADGPTALKAVADNLFDLVLMDIQMPGMNGYEVTEIMRRNSKLDKLPIIAMTAHAMEDARRASLDAGMNDFITKPIEPERFYTLLAQYLELPELSVTRATDSHQKATVFEYLPGIDTKKGLHYTGGNIALYQKLLHEFARYNKDDADTLKRLIEQQQIKEAQRLAHTLKGVAGNLGATELQLICRNIETELPDQISDENLHALVNAHQQVLDSIKQLPDQVERSGTADEPETASCQQLIEQMDALLKQGNMRALELMPKLQSQLEDRFPELIGELKAHLERYRFSDAIETLAQLSNAIREEVCNE